MKGETERDEEDEEEVVRLRKREREREALTFEQWGRVENKRKCFCLINFICLFILKSGEILWWLCFWFYFCACGVDCE